MTLGRLRYGKVKLPFLVKSHPIKTAAYGFLLAILVSAAFVFQRESVLAVKSFWHASVLVWLKVIAYGVIPILLAIFGAHYAAEAIQRKRAKHMARLGFWVSGILCVIMISYIETKGENEHETEVRSLNMRLDAVQGQNTQILQHFVAVAPDAQTREISRRKGILAVLRHEWILSHKDVSPGLLAGTEEPPSDWINQRLNQLGEKWSVKALPPSLVPAKPSGVPYGNLKARCEALTMQITGFIQHRYDQLRNSPAYAGPPTPAKLTEWNRSNDGEFRQGYLPSVVAMHDEFAELHLRDPQLDDILARDQRNAQERSNPQFAWAGWINIEDMKQIAASLEYLASQTSK